jgi:DNA-binding NarL/FixJ family response regulator
MSITVLLADDHVMVRESLASCLNSTPDLCVVASVGRAEDAVEAVQRHQPNVVLLDIDMPGMSAFDAAGQIKSLCPDTRLVMLSAFFHDRYIQQALEAGVCGYIVKSAPVEQIVKAVRDVAAGVACFSPEVQARLVITGSGVSLRDQPRTRLGLLSRRELEVLCYAARDFSYKEIAAHMHLACRTIDHHMARIMAKLDIHGRVKLAQFAIREGLCEA